MAAKNADEEASRWPSAVTVNVALVVADDEVADRLADDEAVTVAICDTEETRALVETIAIDEVGGITGGINGTDPLWFTKTAIWGLSSDSVGSLSMVLK